VLHFHAELDREETDKRAVADRHLWDRTVWAYAQLQLPRGERIREGPAMPDSSGRATHAYTRSPILRGGMIIHRILRHNFAHTMLVGNFEDGSRAPHGFPEAAEAYDRVCEVVR
jgi:hypothetical protein